MVGPYSPRLTLPEKAALRAIEEGDVQGGTSSFLSASFLLVRQALEPHFEEVGLNAILALRLDDAAPDLQSIRKIFWEGEEITPWGEHFLEWEEEYLTDSELSLPIDEINDYLLRSVDFYDALKIDFQSGETRTFESPEPGLEAHPVEVPVLSTDLLDDMEMPEPLLELSLEDPESSFEEVVEEMLEESPSEYKGSSWDTIKIETIFWPRVSEQEKAELGGSSWDTIRVEKIFWKKGDPLQETAGEEKTAERPEGSGELGGSSWDSIKIETIYWPKVGKSAPEFPAPKEIPEATAVLEEEPKPEVYPMGPGAKALVERPVEDEAKKEGKTEESSPPESTRTSTQEDDGEEIVTARAPDDPFAKRNRLVVKNKYLGYGKNSQGVLGLCGQLKVSYFNENEISGKLESSNPLLFLSTKRLSGKNATITYWLPPVAFPHPAGHLSIETPLETKNLSLHTLFPKSRTDLMRDRTVLLCLFLPAILGFLYFALVFALTTQSIDLEAQQTFPELYRAALSGIDTGDFRAQGLGLYRLRVIPAAESMQMIWAALIFLDPLISSKFFYHLSRSRKRRFGGLLAAAQLLPTILLLLTWSFQDLVFPLYSHQDFAPLDLRSFLPWSVGMNLLVGVYLFLSVFGFWDRKIKQSEVRFILPLILSGLYFLTMFVIIYGRSWFS